MRTPLPVHDGGLLRMVQRRPPKARGWLGGPACAAAQVYSSPPTRSAAPQPGTSWLHPSQVALGRLLGHNARYLQKLLPQQLPLITATNTMGAGGPCGLPPAQGPHSRVLHIENSRLL